MRKKLISQLSCYAYHKAIHVLCLMLSLSACTNNGEDATTESSVQKSIAQDTNQHSDNSTYYKRYSGTIAGQPVVVHLQRYGNDIKGSYYYLKTGRVIDLYTESLSGDSIRLSESSVTEAGNLQQASLWNVKQTGNALSGQLVNEDKKTAYPIDLKEEYPAGSTKLGVLYLRDSAKLIDTQSSYTAFVRYQVLLPSASLNANDKKLLDSLFLADVGCKNTDAQKCLQDMRNSYFQAYRSDVTPGPEGHIYGYEENKNSWVLYNDNGWLIVEVSNYDYTGGAHGMYGSGFLNIDMQQHRTWQLGDVINVDSTKLLALLTESANAYFGVKKGEKLSSYLLDLEKPPITGNFYIGPTGLSFNYAPYEIASYAQGQVVLFIPYTKLQAMLTPAFATRIRNKG